MPLIVQDGKLITKNGHLATDLGCCCPPPSPDCNCPNGPVEFPSSITIVFSLGSFFSVGFFDGVCTHDDAVNLIVGTYVLSPTVIETDFVIYTLTTENGATITFKWLCTEGVGTTAEFSYLFCDSSAQCFARVNCFKFISSYELLGLCEYPQNNTDTTTLNYDSDTEFVFLEQGPLLFGCNQSFSITGHRYYFSLAITASW